jgi:predicted type IV restriction endonuclease
MKVAKKTEERIQTSLPKFQKILGVAKARDLNESDTVVIITDLLAEVFGYEKYIEITSELAVRGTYCDLAVKTNDKFQFLIECKAIGTDLKDIHLRQAVGYGANKGIQWIILTNGIDWQVYRIRFEQPISWELVTRFDLLTGNVKNEKFIEALFIVSKEGVEKCVRDDLYEKIQCVNRFVIGALLLSEPVVAAVKKELRKLAEGIRIEETEIASMIKESVLRRDLIEGDEAVSALAKVAKLTRTASVVKTATPKPKAVTKTDTEFLPASTEALLAETESAPSITLSCADEQLSLTTPKDDGNDEES